MTPHQVVSIANFWVWPAPYDTLHAAIEIGIVPSWQVSNLWIPSIISVFFFRIFNYWQLSLVTIPGAARKLRNICVNSAPYSLYSQSTLLFFTLCGMWADKYKCCTSTPFYSLRTLTICNLLTSIWQIHLNHFFSIEAFAFMPTELVGNHPQRTGLQNRIWSLHVGVTWEPSRGLRNITSITLTNPTRRANSDRSHFFEPLKRPLGLL